MLFYCDEFVLPLPETHRFPMQKYRLLREMLQASGIARPTDFFVPPAASDAEILRVHCPRYLERVTTGHMSPAEIRQLGFPWSPELVERSRRSSGATIAAGRVAVQKGFGANLAGGTHHAFFDRGEGFCLFNDSVIAARALQAEGRATRVMVIDADVHQGNGTASLVRNDETVFAFSIHCEKNFPFEKEVSDLDVELPVGTSDAAYLEALEHGLNQAFARFEPDLIIYLAGADPYERDRMGRLKLTKEGLLRRDKLVFELAKQKRLPVVISMAGGYATQVEEIAQIHCQTVELGITELAGRW